VKETQPEQAIRKKSEDPLGSGVVQNTYIENPRRATYAVNTKLTAVNAFQSAGTDAEKKAAAPGNKKDKKDGDCNIF